MQSWHLVFCSDEFGGYMDIRGSFVLDAGSVVLAPRAGEKKPFFLAMKRLFDVVVSLLLLPLLATFALILLLANSWFNAGPLFFVQVRMGRGCRAFAAIKFRSMRCVEKTTRLATDSIEAERITRLGSILRKTRIDELPQILNVLRGEMSLIGPRPDMFSHARTFIREIPEYRARHQVRPGISGLAQVTLGYAVGIEATQRKVRADLYYIQNAGFTFDLYLVARTIITILSRAGV